MPSAAFLTTAATRVAVAGSSFIFSMLLARLLGPDDMGSVFFALSILVGASLVARFGNDVNLIWSTSRLVHAGNYGKANSLLALSLVVAGLLCAFIIPLPWLWQRFAAVPSGSSGAVTSVALALLALPAIVSASLFSACLKAIGQLNRATLLEQGGMFVVALPLVFLLVALGLPITVKSLLLLLVSASLCLAIAGGFWWFNGDHRRRVFSSLGQDESRNFLKSSFNMAVSSAAAYCVHWGNIVLVGLLGSQSEVGLYAVADRIAITQAFVLSIVYVVFSHRLPDAYNSKTPAHFTALAHRSAFIATSGALPICLVVVVFPEQLLSLLGGGYEDATLTLRLLGLAYFLPALSGGGGYVLSLTGHDGDLRNISLGTALLQLPLASVLAWRYGAEGAAGALLVVYIARYLAMQIAIHRKLGFYIIPSISGRPGRSAFRG